MTYQKVTGPLMANSHPGSYCGQDAYSDMLVTDDGFMHRERTTASSSADGSSRCAELYARSTGNITRGGGEMTSENEKKGGDGMMDVSTNRTVVRRLTPL